MHSQSNPIYSIGFTDYQRGADEWQTLHLNVTKREFVSTLDAAKDIRIYECLQLSALTLLIYDHTLTLVDELPFWNNPLSLSSFWFFLNRYFALVGNTLATGLEFLASNSETRYLICDRVNLFRQSVVIINVLVVAVLLSMRTYALYNRSKTILASLLLIGLSLVGVAIWFTFGLDVAALFIPQLNGCHTGIPSNAAYRFAGAWEANLAFDTFIFLLTFFRTWSRRSGLSLWSTSLVALILRDGILYFAAITMVNFANVLMLYFATPYLRASLSTFTATMCVTLISRLMLNLRKYVNADHVRSDDLPSCFPSFAPVQNWQGSGPESDLEYFQNTQFTD